MSTRDKIQKAIQVQERTIWMSCHKCHKHLEFGAHQRDRTRNICPKALNAQGPKLNTSKKVDCWFALPSYVRMIRTISRLGSGNSLFLYSSTVNMTLSSTSTFSLPAAVMVFTDGFTLTAPASSWLVPGVSPLAPTAFKVILYAVFASNSAKGGLKRTNQLFPLEEETSFQRPETTPPESQSTLEPREHRQKIDSSKHWPLSWRSIEEFYVPLLSWSTKGLPMKGKKTWKRSRKSGKPTWSRRAMPRWISSVSWSKIEHV